jgi:hypothetical protein
MEKPDLIILSIGAICTLAIYSILYKENPVFRLFEHIFVGLATGYGVQTVITTVIVPDWGKAIFIEGRWYWIFALLVGGMFYFIYSKKQVWIARWAMGLFIGMGAGLGVVGFVTEFAPQLAASFKPLVEHTANNWQFHDFRPLTLIRYFFFSGSWHFHAENLNNLIFFITLLTVMSYFFFSIEQKKPLLGSSAKTGRWLLMIAFGAIFGNTVMARFSLLIDRMQFLLHDWLGTLLH